MSALKEKLRHVPGVVEFAKILRNLRSIIRLVIGFFVYLVTGKTSQVAYQALITVFCITKGRSNDFFSWMLGKCRQPYIFNATPEGVAGELSGDALTTAVSELKERGYYVFKNRVSGDICDRLLAYATTHPCKMRPMDGEKPGAIVTTIYNRNQPQAVRYEFSQEELLKNPDVQNLLADMSLPAFAQEYLGARPVIDIVALWWNTRFSDMPDSEAAQYFHFDMDRFKWLKIFIYVTDVGPENGPHSFVAGSHRSGAIPSALLDKGYARLSDEEVKSNFAKEDFIEFSAPRGTIIAEDTRGLHKGRHVESGDRLVMQIEFSNCLFGAFYPKSRMPDQVLPELQQRMKQYPDMYAYLEGR